VTRAAVVIPTYNDGGLVRDAVASIQEDEEVEVVVVDDGSTHPASLEVLAALERDGTRVVHKANGGPGLARMAGVAATSAPYVLPVDADDLLVPGAVAAMADALDANPDAAFTWGDYELFGEYSGRYRTPSAWLPWSVTYVNVYPITSMVRRSALERAGGWHEAGYEDWGLWLAFVELGLGGVPTPGIVYRRRLHGAQRQGRQFRDRHQELYGGLLQRHAAAFAARDELRRQEHPPALKRAVYPILFGARSVVPYAVEAWMQRTMMRTGMRLSR
jgi:glycosyltransferase involved in cell wall biosynthesis